MLKTEALYFTTLALGSARVNPISSDTTHRDIDLRVHFNMCARAVFSSDF